MKYYPVENIKTKPDIYLSISKRKLKKSVNHFVVMNVT